MKSLHTAVELSTPCPWPVLCEAMNEVSTVFDISVSELLVHFSTGNKIAVQFWMSDEKYGRIRDQRMKAEWERRANV